VLPVTFAANCCCAPVFSCTDAGDMAMETTELAMETVVEPEMDALESDVAVIATLGGFGATLGAV